MRILLDEPVPRRLGSLLVGHETTTVPKSGWAGIKNGKLLTLAATKFEVFLTTDQNIEFQQNLSALPIAILVVVAKSNYPVYVPQVDRDGNEIGGVRVPEQAVATATTMGWGVRSAASGTPGELCYLDGSSVPFVRSADQRKDFRDPRPSLAERYKTPESYVTRIKAHADTLMRGGYLLDEDAQRIARRASGVKW